MASAKKNPFGQPFPAGARESSRDYGKDNSSKPCSDDKVSKPNQWPIGTRDEDRKSDKSY